MTAAVAREARIRARVHERRDELAELTTTLVQARTVLGDEAGGQDVVDAWLAASGYSITRVVPDADAALADPHAGYPYLPYEGRSSVVGTRAGEGGGRSLHLSGHIDVVPVENPELWRFDPWSGAVADGRVWGRGAGDMKGGLAAYLVAAAVVAETCPDLRGDLHVSSVIEEECGGNGMWSVLRAGFDADATLIGEPTDLQLTHAGTGVVWARLTARGAAGHSAYSGGDGPFDQLARAVAGLRVLEAAANTPPRDEIFAAVSPWPYGMTVGRIGGGVWTASAPAELHAWIRFGIGLDREPADVQASIVDAVAVAAPGVEVAFEAFRAPAFVHRTDGPLPDLLRQVHEEVVGSAPRTSALTATTDARQVQGACMLYGPVAGAFHGTDEWVDIASLEQVATVIALVASRWLD